ncbi:hypothetical protein QYF61_024631 [Mycteria americana]|uniref:CCHC-type domain-containing protein n=1 Tax=Mycteria americana TaxID=33587 RepID=A0AAN7S4H6_MYCAM|nr:hypothetical protein QYF61_024631 [Mycteria americana]
MLFLRREGKWDEVVYADMFFTLRNHPEWQKECGINLAPQDPMVLAIEKERNKQNRILKRCCSACSIGQRCLKVGSQNERLEDYLPPLEREGDREGDAGAVGREEPEMREREETDIRFSPITTRTRSKVGPAIQAPLRQAMGVGGPVRIKVPFTLADLDGWRVTAGSYRDDPERVAKGFELIVKTQDPDWEDVDAMLDAVFSESEKQMVVRAARTQVQALVLAGTLPGTVDNHVPITNPGWDPNQTGTRNLLGRYREWIAYGIRNAVPKSVNWSKLYEIKQDKKESPTDFLNRLKEGMRKYTPLDPTSQEGKSQLIFLFLGQSVDDIRRKLQKVQGADARDLERLLETAWQVYRNRDSRKEKQVGKTIANATVAALRTVEGQIPPRSNSNEGRGVMRSGASAPLRGKRGNQPLLRDQCVYCKQLGHWKKNCPRLGKPVMVANTEEN